MPLTLATIGIEAIGIVKMFVDLSASIIEHLYMLPGMASEKSASLTCWMAGND